MGFNPPVVETTEIIEERDGEWTPVVVAEEKAGFVVKDKRKVR